MVVCGGARHFARSDTDPSKMAIEHLLKRDSGLLGNVAKFLDYGHD
jgi:hypothetical protein